eukprot:m.37594 g.37594  ORF g.37594 m.37594 type:complete len:132 (-) comp11398_c0_seq2:408-803(-)
MQAMITHPLAKCPKKYLVTLDARYPLEPNAADRFAEGLQISNSLTCRPAQLEVVCPEQQQYMVTIYEGFYHQVKVSFLVLFGEFITATHSKLEGYFLQALYTLINPPWGEGGKCQRSMIFFFFLTVFRLNE